MKENYSVKDKKGSITIFVLIALLFMSAFLIISYASNVNKSKIAKEQLDIIKGIYKGNENVVNSYQDAYTALRNKNKQTLTSNVEDSSTIELSKTFDDKISNYKIFGSSEGVGDLVTDTTNENFNKYVIQVKITGSKTDNSKTYEIVLNSPLLENEYIDFISKKVVRSDGTEETINDLPELQTFEDYSKIEILTQTTPNKIEVEYKGHTLEE